MVIDSDRELRLRHARLQGERDAQQAREDWLLDQPDAQPVIRRIGEACNQISGLSRRELDTHIRAVVLNVLDARANPRHPINPRFNGGSL